MGGKGGSVLPGAGTQKNETVDTDGNITAEGKAQDATRKLRADLLGQIQASTDLDAFTKQEIATQAAATQQGGYVLDQEALTNLFSAAKKKDAGSVYAARALTQEQIKIAQDQPGQKQTLLTNNNNSTILTG